MSLRNITVQYVCDTLYMPPLEREVNHIIVRNEDMKEWEHFEPERTYQMSDKKPCPLCGDDSEYLRFLDLCAERANEIQRENESRTFTNMCKSLDFVQVVRCKECKFSELVKVRYSDKKLTICNAEWCEGSEGDHPIVDPDGFCAWGVLNDARNV